MAETTEMAKITETDQEKEKCAAEICHQCHQCLQWKQCHLWNAIAKNNARVQMEHALWLLKEASTTAILMAYNTALMGSLCSLLCQLCPPWPAIQMQTVEEVVDVMVDKNTDSMESAELE
jgi:hypothetical protein